MNTRSSFKKITNSDEHEDEKHLVRQPRPLNDMSALLKMMSTMIDNNAAAVRSQSTINRNRRTIPDYADSSTDDEGLTLHYYGKIKHFSHPHNLDKYNFQQDSKTNCKICGLQLVGSGYGCESCQFCVHASCFDLPQKIQHDAHPAHPLTLRYPSYYKHCVKYCNACSENIERSFLYCCDICHFDLHVTCATLYNIVKRHNASIFRLYYTFPVPDSYFSRYCTVCYKRMSKEGWSYYCKDSDYIAHINCAKGKLEPSWIKERLNMLKIK